jgi:hypothetical protein
MRRFCFTKNQTEGYDGWSLEGLWPRILELHEEGKVTYACIGREVGDRDQGRHLQGYIQFSTKRTIVGVCRLLGTRTVNYAVANGTGRQNKAYCSKSPEAYNQSDYDDGSPAFVEIGDLTSQGEGSSLANVARAIVDESKSVREIALTHPEVFLRHSRGIPALVSHAKARDIPFLRSVRCQVLWGEPGTGKTYSVFNKYKEQVYRLADNKKPWFDGYDNEPVLLIDEFDPYQCMPISIFKQVLEGYKMKVPIKGGMVYAAWKIVIVISNVDPQQWYPNSFEADRRAVFSRLGNNIHECKGVDHRNGVWFDAPAGSPGDFENILFDIDEPEPEPEPAPVDDPYLNAPAE